jgi:hypothetical protein
MRLILQRAALGLLATAMFGWFGHALFTETGPVGWFNSAQQSLLGHYSMKMSAALTLAVLMAAGGALWAVARNAGWMQADPEADRVLFGRAAAAGPQIPGGPQAAGEPGVKALVVTGAVAIALVWAFGLGWPAYSDWQQRQDVAARYEPMHLAQTAQMPRPQGRHLALRGRLLEEQLLTHSTGSGATRRDDYHLIPVAAADWAAGRPVAFLLKVERLDELRPLLEAQDRAGGAPAAQPLRVRLDGAPPVPAVQAYAARGVPMAADSHLLRLVRTEDGARQDPRLSAFDREFMLLLCTAMTAMIVIALPLGWWARRWRLARGRRMG